MKELFFKLAALVILAAFYGCYLTKMLLQRRRGIRTDQMGKDKVGFVKAIEVTLKLVTYLVPAAELLSIFLCVKTPADALRAAGIVFGVLGDAVFIASVVTMKDSWRAGVSETDRTELVTSGIYSISRNPAFLGFDLVYVGILLLFFNPVLLIISAFAALMFHLQIVNVEEDHLLRAFGDDYLAYRKHVNRYLGRR